MSCYLSYDLAYTIVENWLLGACDKGIRGEPTAELDFDFIKIMMVNRTFKQIFFRLFKQNFSYEIYQSFGWNRLQLFVKEEAPLFREVEMQLERTYGKIELKWLFAFLVENDAVCERCRFLSISLPVEEPVCQFSSSETKLQSFMRLIYHKEDEFDQISKIWKDVSRNANVVSLKSTIHFSGLSDSCYTAAIARIFNVGAAKVCLLFPNATVVEAENLVFKAPVERIGNGFLHLHNLILETYNLDQNATFWKDILFYVLEASSNLEELKFEFHSEISAGGTERFLQSLASLIAWILIEVLPVRLETTEVLLSLNTFGDGDIHHEAARTFLEESGFIVDIVFGNMFDLHVMATSQLDNCFKVDWT